MSQKLPQVMKQLLAQVNELIARLPPEARAPFQPPRCRQCGHLLDFSTGEFCSLKCISRYKVAQRRAAKALERSRRARK